MDESNITIPPVADDPVTPLEFLETVYACNELPLNVRMRAAVAAAQYRHPKLAVQTNFNFDVDLGARLERARQISAEVKQARIEGREYRPPPKVIEAKVIAGSPEHPAEEMAKPFASMASRLDRRF